MFPLRDNIPSRTVPVVNYALIAMCAFAFVVQLTNSTGDQDPVAEAFGMIPQRVMHPEEPVVTVERRLVRANPPIIQEVGRELASSPMPAWLTIFTCMFLHGGWLHFLGNMWFLNIFGDNVEDRFGHGGYLLLYLGCGIAAGVAHLLTNLNSPIPTIGASGAIAGVMGAYMVCYPRAMVVTLIPFIILQIIVLPAPFFLGVWFLIQLAQGAMTDESTGVAWWAHIGGFAAGYVVAHALEITHHLNPKVQAVRPRTERMGVYRFRQ
jgi:membrane associated rhomboid family serine protease